MEIKIETKSAEETISQDTRILAAVGYLPMFFLLPLLLRPKERFCRFHGLQSLILLMALAIFWIFVYITDFLLGRIMGNVILIGFIFKIFAWMIHYLAGTVVSLLYIILVIIGFVQAAAGQYWRMPVLNTYAQRLHLWSDLS
ncbi:MAG: hypothetical protein ABIK39_01895 [candidate division WOR-3 bacterium]